jgi:hypothetical protein
MALGNAIPGLHKRRDVDQYAAGKREHSFGLPIVFGIFTIQLPRPARCPHCFSPQTGSWKRALTI